jgi:hypothetical protein
MQVVSAGFQVPGEPRSFILAVPSKSPNAAVNLAEAECSAHRAALLENQNELPQEFFCSVAPIQAGRPWELYQANYSGGLKKVADLVPGIAVMALHYNGHAQQLVCIASNFTMTTYAECDEGWSILATMRFASKVSSSSVMIGHMRSVWAGMLASCNVTRV